MDGLSVHRFHKTFPYVLLLTDPDTTKVAGENVLSVFKSRLEFAIVISIGWK